MAFRAMLLGLTVAATLGPSAAAEDATDPLVITVRASRVEAGEGALERQERLVRRAQQRDFAFRSICNGCAAMAARASAAPFHPLDALAASRRAPTPPE